MHPHRIIRSAALGLTLAALAASTASAVPADLRSPDARDAARTEEALTGVPRQDLRSPDARDAARAASQAEAQRQPGPARAAGAVVSTSSDDDTLAIALSGAAFGLALAGLAVALGALVRPPRSRWSVN